MPSAVDLGSTVAGTAGASADLGDITVTLPPGVIAAVITHSVS